MASPFERVAIVNRGDPAMRFIHAARELCLEGAQRLRTIALFTAPDAHAMFVREADEAVSLGEATFVDERDGQRKSSYLDHARLEHALRTSGAEAAWVGWGFVAEQPSFAELCRRLGIVFIGPDPEVMRLLGDKISCKRLAEQVQVPVLPWSGGPVETLDDARAHADRLRYPLLVKATAGGGGRGIRVARADAELPAAFESARTEALHAFGDATVFLERLATGARHIEVQIVADRYGTTWALGTRDCTVQRRNQKLLEEAPAPGLTAAQERELEDRAVRLVTAAGYVSAGTVEFLLDRARESFAFMEVNARLQVEHPVTEMTTGADLVKLQIAIARGERLGDPRPPLRGHAIEVRLNAEDAENGFAPAPGVIEVLRMPAGPGIRVDTGVAQGDTVPAEFDSMIAKVIAHGRTRPEALARLRRALDEMAVVIDGGTSTKAFLVGLLGHPDVAAPALDTGWLDRLAASGAHVPRGHGAVALLAAAIESYDAERKLEETQFFAGAARGRPSLRAEAGCTVELRHRAHRYRLIVRRTGPSRYSLRVDGSRLDVEMERLGAHERRMQCNAHRYRVLSMPGAFGYQIEVDGVLHRISSDDAGVVRAPSPAVVSVIDVHDGDEVAAGQRVAVLEAMKMEMAVLAPFAGHVRRVVAAANVQVAAGASLLVLEPTAHMEEATDAERVVFAELTSIAAAPTASGERRGAALEAQLRYLFLGYDYDRAEARALAAERAAAGAAASVDDALALVAEDDLLEIFVDVSALFESRSASPDATADEDDTPTEQDLLAYLRAIDAGSEKLLPRFAEALRRALVHYGVTGLEPSQQLRESLLWLYKAHRRRPTLIEVVIGILERRLENADALAPIANAQFRRTLDRLIAVTERRHQALSDFARQVRHRYFDHPLFESARQRAYASVERTLDGLLETTNTAERASGLRALVECPYPLVSLWCRHFAAASTELQAVMLEVLLRRYYRIRALERVRIGDLAGRRYVAGEYHHDGHRIHVIMAYAGYHELAGVISDIGTVLADVPRDEDVMIDVLVARPDAFEDADATAERLGALVERVRLPRLLRRIVFAIASPESGAGIGGMQHFTFRSNGAGYVEDRVVRGLHPMMAKRLQLWRLANFTVERVPSVEDVYVLQGVARENPKDVRLFAFAEVRDLTQALDEHGRVVQLPHFEHMLREALAAIRGVQSRRGPAQRLYWNRVLLYVWPPLTLSATELHEIAQRLAPLTAGAGLEKVVLRVSLRDHESGAFRDTVIHVANPAGRGVELRFTEPADQPIRSLSEYGQKVVRMRERGLMYPYEIVRMLTPPRAASQSDYPPGEFTEYDLDGEGALRPVARAWGNNVANVVVGVLRSFTVRHPEGITRVMLLGDPSRSMGSLAEPECRRILAALDLAERLRVPLEWIALSAGAKISMETGTETMDWIADVLRRLIEFTQAGGEVNVIAHGINVGAQPYFNAEATMLMHTRGILVMTPDGAMVLTGKHALDYSGGVSAEDNQGIGGYDQVMGPNGQAQYWAEDLGAACRLMLRHYEATYVVPGERFPRRATTIDSPTRDVRESTEACGEDFATVGDVFGDACNPGRKKPFAMRAVMAATVDQDWAPLERWVDMRDAEIAIVWDAFLGGYPVCLLGIESRPLVRTGFVPGDGPDQWTAGTLFPQASKKIARAINAASGNRPIVVLANLSGFDGSPESMRKLQLEYGAEIGRAVVNFDGPIVFCVVSRYHGGAFVVFSRVLNANFEVAALAGAHASVIGGAPAAAVVFAGEVDARTRRDPRVATLDEQIARAGAADKARLQTERGALYAVVRSEKLGEVADEFDHVHSVERALRVGSLDRVIPPAELRPYLIDAIERGMRRTLEHGTADRDARQADVRPMAADLETR